MHTHKPKGVKAECLVHIPSISDHNAPFPPTSVAQNIHYISGQKVKSDTVQSHNFSYPIMHCAIDLMKTALEWN